MTEPNDKALDEYLKRESPVSQRYREIEANDVPPQLDATVLAQAREAVANRSKRRPTWMKWGAPLALAASAVMAVAIVLESGVQDEVRAPAPQMEQTTSVQGSDEARVVEEFTANTSPDVQRDLRAPVSPQAEVPAQQPEAREEDAVAERARERKAAPAPEPRVAKAEREQYAQDSAAEVRVTGAAESSERALAQRRAASEPARAAPPPATAISERRAVAGPATPMQAPTAAMQQAPRLPAEEWLEQIRALRREGKVLEADEQWREFEKTYPDFVVSETDAARPKQ